MIIKITIALLVIGCIYGCYQLAKIEKQLGLINSTLQDFNVWVSQ